MYRVLIIEDEFLTALNLEALLAPEGATDFAFAQTEADALAEAHRDPPDVVISDVRLREGSGVDAVKAIRDDLGPLPVIFATGNPEACAGFPDDVEVIVKPIDPHAIAAAFRRLVPARPQA